MTPGKFDLALYRGDSYSWRVRLWSDNGTIPVDLTGATVAAQFRDKPGGQIMVTFETTIELPNTVLLKMTPPLWATAPKGGSWDLQVTDVDGDVSTVLAGAVRVTADVTVVGARRR